LDRERKIQIIKAAVKRFSKHGINKTTLEEVARDLRIGKATIYHYFNSKEDLYFKTLDYEISLYLEELKHLLNNESLSVKEIISAYLGFKESCSVKYKLIFDMLLHVITGTHIDPEIHSLRELLNSETAVVKEKIKRVYKKEETSYAALLVLQSWGFLFGSILGNAAAAREDIHMNEDDQKKKIENLISELGSIFS
jgi:AcrR family transcriptional regulator